MIPYSQALALLMDAAKERGIGPFQTVPLKDAPGRVASGRVVAAEDLPAFANSAMDGYAVPSLLTAKATGGCPVRLRISGSLAAGDRPAPAAEGAAVEIMTGAPLPEGCDAVVRLEDARRGETHIELDEPALRGDFVRDRGADFAAGAVIVDGGTVIEPRHVLALAALGIGRLSVRAKPRVALISTGRELVEFSQRPQPGQIRNATGPYLEAALAARGAEVKARHNVGDDPQQFKQRLEALAEEVDLIIATGGVSMGRHDFVPQAVAEMGADVLFHKTATRPGKPVLAASFGNGPLFFGLPGNPVSTVVALRFFIDPVLRFFSGRPPETPRPARLAATIAKPDGLRCFYKGKLGESSSGLEATALAGQASFQIAPLLEADCWIVLGEAGTSAAAGSMAQTYPL